MRRRPAFTVCEPRVSSTRQRAAFTLVELLVVIGIIALLISILLPALSKAQRSARQTACMSNERQILSAVMIYTNQWKGMLPNCNWAKAGDGVIATRQRITDKAAARASFIRILPVTTPPLRYYRATAL